METSNKEKTEMSIKRPCRYSVSISESQQGFLYAIDAIIQCVIVKMLPNRCHYLNEFASPA